MNISTELTHLDERLAVCAATLNDGETHISAYASALVTESARYPDLAQQRAVDLVLNLQVKGGEAIRGLAFPTPPASTAAPAPALVARPASLVEKIPNPAVSNSVSQPEPSASDSPNGLEESDISPW